MRPPAKCRASWYAFLTYDDLVDVVDCGDDKVADVVEILVGIVDTESNVLSVSLRALLVSIGEAVVSTEIMGRGGSGRLSLLSRRIPRSFDN